MTTIDTFNHLSRNVENILWKQLSTGWKLAKVTHLKENPRQ